MMFGSLLITILAGMMTVLTLTVYCAAVTAKRVPCDQMALEAHYEALCLSAGHLHPTEQTLPYPRHPSHK